MAGMTVREVKQKKIDLEMSVLELLKAFESETKMKVSYINTQRKRDKEKKSRNGEMAEPYEPYKGDLTNVDINVELDVVM